MTDDQIDRNALAAFLRARSTAITDEDQRDMVEDLAGDVVDHGDVPAVIEQALWVAAAWKGHPDYRPEWRLEG